MSQVLMGKLLPNLKITLGNDADIDETIEEGEILDSTEVSECQDSPEKSKQNVEIVRNWMETLQNPKVYENRNGAFITGLDLSSQVIVKKLEERAARFGLEKKEERQITQQEIDALYSSLGIDLEDLNSCKLKDIRLDAIHMRGVNEMNTNDVFKYFQDYGPSSVEWINDFSCNVVWLDETSTARALLGLSRPLVIKKKTDIASDVDDSNDKDETLNKEKEAVILMSDSDESETDEKENSSQKADDAMEIDSCMDSVNAEDSSKVAPCVDVPVPPGHWRLGMPNPKAKAILLRFATKDDRKLPGAEKRSQYYQKYGNPNYGGLKGLISASRKRKIQAARNRQVIGKLSENKPFLPLRNEPVELLSKSADKQSKRSKQPRMRMYADDEEEKKKDNKRFKASAKQSVHSRLGTKYTKNELCNLGNKFTNSDEEEEFEVPITRKVSTRFNIWTDIARSMAEEENHSTYGENYETDRSSNNFRNVFKSSSSKRSNLPYERTQVDLRSKLNRIRKDTSALKHRSPLYVYCKSGNGSD